MTNPKTRYEEFAWQLKSCEVLSNKYILEHIDDLDAEELLKNKRLNLTDELKMILQLKLL